MAEFLAVAKHVNPHSNLLHAWKLEPVIALESHQMRPQFPHQLKAKPADQIVVGRTGLKSHGEPVGTGSLWVEHDGKLTQGGLWFGVRRTTWSDINLIAEGFTWFKGDVGQAVTGLQVGQCLEVDIGQVGIES